MIPPTSIDGTDITGATIDGTDVQEITVDGDVVFTSTTADPVAKSDLIAWYRFESSGLLTDSADNSSFGDATAYDLTEQGQSTTESNSVSSGGATDVIDGTSSGYYDMVADGNIEASLTNLSTPFTVMGWFNPDGVDTGSGNQALFGDWDGSSSDWYMRYRDGTDELTMVDDIAGNQFDLGSFPSGQWSHITGVYDSTDTAYIDGSVVGTLSASSQRTFTGGDGLDIGSLGNSLEFYDGGIDDVRIYNRALTSSEINQIITNTQP